VFNLKIISITLCILALNINIAQAETSVQADQESGSYLISGEILLDDTFTGSTNTQQQGASCLGCAWLVSAICFVFDENYVISTCSSQTECQTVENTLGEKKKIWRRLGTNEPWLVVGFMCVGPKGPSTPEKLTNTLKEKTIEYLPQLIPSTQPTQNVLVNVDVYFLSNQSNSFGPKTVIVTGIPVTLSANASWVWRFSDGTVINTNNPGAGHPAGIVKHSFSTKGLHTISVTTTWNASWKTNSKVSVAVPGKSLTQTTTFSLIAHEAAGVLTR